MYRSGWSYKDRNQERILAITLTKAGFLTLLSMATLSHGPTASTTSPVRVQWDPERSVRLGKLEHRSLQLGISGESVTRQWMDEWTVKIEDITDQVREWKAWIDDGGDDGIRKVEQALGEGVWKEEVFEVDEELALHLGMT